MCVGGGGGGGGGGGINEKKGGGPPGGGGGGGRGREVDNDRKHGSSETILENKNSKIYNRLFNLQMY